MDLSKIVSITGKPGLFRVIAETKQRIIVETLDDQKKRIPVSANFQIAVLDKITIYTNDGSDLFLKDILKIMDESKAEIAIPDPKNGAAELMEYFGKIAPKYDRERVYVSDVKKIIKWYFILYSTQNIEVSE